LSDKILVVHFYLVCYIGLTERRISVITYNRRLKLGFLNLLVFIWLISFLRDKENLYHTLMVFFCVSIFPIELLFFRRNFATTLKSVIQCRNCLSVETKNNCSASWLACWQMGFHFGKRGGGEMLFNYCINIIMQ